MLITGRYQTEYEAAVAVARWQAAVFMYVSDPERIDRRPADRWPPRAEIENLFRGTGKVRDDCDGGAFAAVYAMADLGFKARVLMGWTEPYRHADGKILSEYHMVCETDLGYVIDTRFPGRVLTWEDQPKFTRDRMSGFFEFGEIAKWCSVKQEPGASVTA